MPNASSKKEEPLYNSRIINSYIKLIKRKYPSVNIREMLDYAAMKPQEVDDQGHWFTQTQVDRFYEQAVALTGNENIAREAGRYAASPDSIGAMRQYVLGLSTPAKVYELIGKTTQNFTRSSKYESNLISPNKVEIVVSPYQGTKEKPFQCENRKGFFEAIVMVFNNKPPQIEHPECIFRGDKVCRYIITWEKNFNTYYKILRNYLLLFMLLIALGSLALLPFKSWALLMAALAVGMLSATLIGEYMDK